MKMYQSVKDHKLAQLVREEEDKVTLNVEGEERVITKSTLRRWWKPVEIQTQEPVKEVPVAQPEADPEPKQEPTAEPKKDSKPNKKGKKAKQDFSELHANMLDFMNKMSAERGIEVFKATKTKGFYSLKFNGKMYMALTLSTKSGINLWLRSKAVEGICECSHMNHMFDARVTISDWEPETCKILVALHDASLAFTKSKALSKSK